MNIFALTRFAMNVLIVLMISAFWLTYALTEDVAGGTWAAAIFGVAALCGVAMTIIAVMRPKDAKISNDELAQRTNVNSYAFGYWVTLAAFLSLLALVLTDRLAGETAFFIMGTPLGIAPAAFMIWGYVTGRAG